jgi:hypothetical protein
MTAQSQNYELWDTNRFLGVYRDVKYDNLYWSQWFQNEILSEDEFIDFEKMPIKNRKLAPFVMPLARGKSIYDDTSTGFRFKPAYSKLEDRIDPLMPLTRRVGIDGNMSQYPSTLSPAQRLTLIRAAMTAQHFDGMNRLWNYMACVALRDGQITLSGKDYPTTVVNFQRAANHTVTLDAGSRWGDAGISILDFFQLVIDRMTNADFGGVPVRATMGGKAWKVMRDSAEIQKFLDTNFAQFQNVQFERTLVTGDPVYPVGRLYIGGGSGAYIELWVDNSTFKHPETEVVTRYIGNHQVLFTSTAEVINGFQAFGRIIDRAANWAPMRLFPKNWVSQGDVEVEYITHKSAPLMVPLNPNGTLLANVVAPD